MAKRKKTIKVEDLLEYANKQLARPESDIVTISFKAGICTMIERVLLDTGNYNGFCFNDPDNTKTDTFGYYSRKYFLT